MVAPLNLAGFGDRPAIITLGYALSEEVIEVCPVNTLGFGDDPAIITLGYACDAEDVELVADETCPIVTLGFGDDPAIITLGYACDAEDAVDEAETVDVINRIVRSGGSGRRDGDTYPPGQRPRQEIIYSVFANLITVNGRVTYMPGSATSRDVPRSAVGIKSVSVRRSKAPKVPRITIRVKDQRIL